MVSVYDRKKNRTNLITIAWCGIVSSTPARFYISVRPSRYSHKLLKKEKAFIVNIPSGGLALKTDAAGMVSGRNIDKINTFQFITSAAKKVSAEMLDECPINLECETENMIHLDSHDMFIARIIYIHCDRRILTKSGLINFKKAKLFTYNNGE